MGWVVRDGHVLASVEVASSFGARLKGLRGRDDLAGAMLLRPAKSVHTIGMRFPIDVAHLDRDLCVLKVTTMPPWRVGRPVPRAHSVLEATAGAFASWELRVGDVLELRE
jgi:uncharacterized membrane protein (UPF0127 family)